MTFLNPALLWALPLSLLPVLLHLLFLQRARKLAFSDLSLMRQVYLKTLPRSRLRQWLLILVRCLMILLLVLAFSRPMLRGSGPSAAGPEEEGLRLVLLLDASYSMGFRTEGRTRFEHALKAAGRLVAALRPADRVALGIFSDRLEGAALAWATPAEAGKALEEAALLPRPTDLRHALEAAFALLAKEEARRKGILVLSDGARHGFRRLESLAALPFFDPAVRVLGLSWPESGGNAYLAGGVLAEEGGRPALKVQTALSGPPRPDWGLRLMQYARAVQGRRVRLEAARTQATLPLDAQGEVLWGKVELQKDNLPLDDSLYYAYRFAPRPKVLALYGSPEFLRLPRGGYFLKRLASSSGGSLLPVDVDLMDFGAFRPELLSGYRSVLLGGFRRVPAQVSSALAAFVRKGGGLWFLPEPGWEGGLEDLLPARLGPPTEAAGPLKLQLDSLPDSSPWRFRWKDFQLERVVAHRAYALLPKPGSSVWARTSRGEPAWVYGRAGKGRVLVWSTPLDLGWTNLPLKPVFMPLLSAFLGELSAQEFPSGSLMLRVGQPFVRQWSPGEDLPTGLSILTPERRRLNPYLKGRSLEFPATDLPGHYELSFDDEKGRRREMFAVNLDLESGESDLAVQAPLPWKSLDPDRLGTELLSEFYGVEARGGVLYLVLLLFGLETLLSRRREPRTEGVPARQAVLAAGLAFFFMGAPARAQAPEQRIASDRFFWTQLKLGDGDPYPGVHEEVLRFLATTTSIAPALERRVTSLEDPGLFASPFLVLAGREAPPDLTDGQVQRLRAYLTAGGFLWVEDASGQRSSPFDRWVRRAFKTVFPDGELEPIPTTHALFRSFYLLRSVAGRTSLSPHMEGVDWGGRTAVLYSRNDLLGAWAVDALGQPLLPCAPGGESQRMNARKVTANIVMYALTGTYKLDAVHQPFILEKLRRAIP